MATETGTKTNRDRRRRRPQPRLTPELGARLERSGRPDPATIAMLHAVRRLAAGHEPATAAERAASEVWRAADPAAAAALRAAAEAFFALPRSQRGRIASPALVDLAVDEALTEERLRDAVKEAAVLAGGDPPPAPRVVDVLVTAWDGGAPREVTLVGTGFGSDPGRFAVTVRPLGGSPGTVAEGGAGRPRLLPTRCTPGALTVAWPAGELGEGDLVIEVADGAGISWDDVVGPVGAAAVEVWWPKPPPPPPPLPPVTVTKITPEGQRAGETVLVDGTGFQAATGAVDGSEVRVEGLSPNRYARAVRADGVEIEFGWKATIEHGSTTQIMLRLGFDIPPGEYAVSVVTRSGSAAAVSDKVVYVIAPWNFVVNFLRMVCLDESDEWSSADELVTAWAVAADARVVFRASREYESVDEGDTIHYDLDDREVLSPGEPVARQLTVVTRLFEWDSDVDTSGVQSLMKLSSELVAVFQASGPPNGVVPQAIDTVSAVLADRLSAWGDAAKNDLGEQRLAFDVAELMQRTQGPKRSFQGDITFNNPDSEGSHRLHFEVMRVD